MELFDLDGAKAFANGFGSVRGRPEGSFRDFVEHELGGTGQYGEPDALFSALRDCLLRDAERSLFLSISQYRRGLDLLTSAASAWAEVTLYYGSYYSACSILGLFGGGMHAPEWVLDAASKNPGAQVLRIKKHPKSPNRYNGSHRFFWDTFYSAAGQLEPWAPSTLTLPLHPVNNSVTWLIDRRNDVNYDTNVSIDAIQTFQSTFNIANFPSTLQGPLATQFEIAHAMIDLALWFWHEIGCATDALSKLGAGASLYAGVQSHIRNAISPFAVGQPILIQNANQGPFRLA